MKEIRLSQGKVAVVSDHRFEFLNQWKWKAQRNDKGWYAVRQEKVNGKYKTLLMHKEIANPPDGFQVDHKDLDGLNNVDENLRICTQTQNTRNRNKFANNQSGYKGVWRDGDKYRAAIRVDNKPIHLGMFIDPVDAAHAYDAKARELFGEFARTNF